MMTSRLIAGAALIAACAALQGCGAYGPRGDRGLPPAPENVAYPNLNRDPADPNRRLRSPAEQRTLKADILAQKPRR